MSLLEKINGMKMPFELVTVPLPAFPARGGNRQTIEPGVTREEVSFGPRGGFAYNVGGRNDLVIRGGSGMFFNFPVSNVTYRQQFYNNSITAAFFPSNKGFRSSFLVLT